MKNTAHFSLGLVLLALSCSPGVASAQDSPATAPGTGYWNLETNLAIPRRSLVRFYNGQHQLVHEESLIGRCLNQRHRLRRRTMRHLNGTLARVLQAPCLENQTPSRALLGGHSA
ncbi:MAG TPA: hypothetical protein VF690_04080 [Hymenobacter sp.]|jgi:hypothetical protein